MISPTLTANIFSKLGNPSSLLPIAVKDAGHSAGMTTASYITGKEVEGKDRLIDEFGTQIIWIGGLPFYKKVVDYTVYKIAGHNPNVDVRVLKDSNVKDMAIKYAYKTSEEIKKGEIGKIGESIAKAAEHSSLFKNLALAKFIAATAMTLGSYFALTTFRHNHTQKKLEKEIHAELN